MANLLSEVVPPNRIEELKETGDGFNMAIPLADVGNFRLSAMRQRGTYAAVRDPLHSSKSRRCPR